MIYEKGEGHIRVKLVKSLRSSVRESAIDRSFFGSIDRHIFQVSRKGTVIYDLAGYTVIVNAVAGSLKNERDPAAERFAAVFDEKDQINDRSEKGKNRSNIVNCGNFEELTHSQYPNRYFIKKRSA